MAIVFVLDFELFFFLLCFAADFSHSYQFLESPLNTTAIEGGVAHLPCRVGSTDTSIGPRNSYWTRLKDNHLISENNDVEKYAARHRSFAERISVLSDVPYEFRLQISDLELEDAGYYVCWHLDENNFSHYSQQAYLDILPRTTESWFPSCSVTTSGSETEGATVGSRVRFTCQAPNGLQLPRDIGLYVKNGHGNDVDIPIATCDHVPCSFEYTLSLVDVNSRFICGTQINNEIFEEECTVTPLRPRQEVNLESVPTVFEINSSGKLLCWTADYGSNYKYQWFLNDTAVSRSQSENHLTINTINESLNNSVVTCVVSDTRGYVGSKSVHLLVVIATERSNDDQMVSQESDLSYPLTPTKVKGLTVAERDFPNSKFPSLARPSEASVMDQSLAKGKLFGIPIEFLIFMLGMLLILLLLLIIVVLLMQRQKRQQNDLTSGREKQAGDIEKGDPCVISNAKGDVIILKSPTPQCSYPPPSSNEPSFYDNVSPNDESQSSCKQVKIFNALSSKEEIFFGTTDLADLQASDDRKHWSVQDTDYTILDPDVVSEDSLDFDTLKGGYQHSSSSYGTSQTFGSNVSGRTYSVKNQPTNVTKHSNVSRHTSLPVGLPLNSPCSLYAVTSLITPEKEKQIEYMLSFEENLGGSSGPSSCASSSRHGSQSDYATPNNRPKSRNFTPTECSGDNSSSSDDSNTNVALKGHCKGISHGDHRPISELDSMNPEYAEISDSQESCKSASGNSLSSNCHSMVSAEVTINKPAAIVKLESPTDGTQKILVLDDSKYIANCRKVVAPGGNENVNRMENTLEKTVL